MTSQLKSKLQNLLYGIEQRFGYFGEIQALIAHVTVFSISTIFSFHLTVFTSERALQIFAPTAEEISTLAT
jgi:hypothetical protein